MKRRKAAKAAKSEKSVLYEYVTSSELGEGLAIGERQLTRVFEFVNDVKRDAGGRNPRARVADLLYSFYGRAPQAAESRRETFLLSRIYNLESTVKDLQAQLASRGKPSRKPAEPEPVPEVGDQEAVVEEVVQSATGPGGAQVAG